VSLQILRKLELRDVLALRVASRTLNAIVSRMFPTVFPKRRIYLNEILLRETGIWGIDELRALRGLRELYASGGPVEVYIVAQATKDESAQVHGFPTYSQTQLLLRGARQRLDGVEPQVLVLLTSLRVRLHPRLPTTEGTPRVLRLLRLLRLLYVL
jgi:hypothetical protein